MRLLTIPTSPLGQSVRSGDGATKFWSERPRYFVIFSMVIYYKSCARIRAARRRRAASEGFTILGALIPATILAVALHFFIASPASSRKAELSAHKHFVAEAFASELLELFRSETPDQFLNFLQSDIDERTSRRDYYLCSHINLLNRSDSTATKPVILNPDPIANLPPSILDGAEAKKKANRFYQVNVMDMSNAQLTSGYCEPAETFGALALAIPAPPKFYLATSPNMPLWRPSRTAIPNTNVALKDNERFFVTVGVSWIESTDITKRVVLSTIIPNP